MKSGLSMTAMSCPLFTNCPGRRDVRFTTPPIVMATEAQRCGVETIVPLKITSLGRAVAAVVPSTRKLSFGVSKMVSEDVIFVVSGDAVVSFGAVLDD